MKAKKAISVMLTTAMVMGMAAGSTTVYAEDTREEVRVLIKWSESQISNWTALVD